MGLVANAAGVKFDYVRVYDPSVNTNVVGRWSNSGSLYAAKQDANTWLRDAEGVRMPPHGITGSAREHNPILRKGVRLDRFQATYTVNRLTSQGAFTGFVFNAKDHDEYNMVRIYHDSAGSVPQAFKFVDGNTRQLISGTAYSQNMPSLTQNDTLHVRIAQQQAKAPRLTGGDGLRMRIEVHALAFAADSPDRQRLPGVIYELERRGV